MASIAQALVAKSKGILAADESTGTIAKRLTLIGMPSTEENRRDWRELLFTADGFADYISGVILYDETIRQKAKDGTPFVDLLNKAGVIPGIKVDMGAKPLAGSPDEKVTEGLDGLRERLAEYRKIGARFAKWRAVIDIAADQPSNYCLDVNAHALARYAALCQEADIVPIVEPEVLMDGDHDIDRCYEVTSAALRTVFAALDTQRVVLEEMLLKPNMVISGKKCPTQASAAEIAEKTVRCFRNTVPAAVPGIVFLSGGQSDEDATANLDAINRIGNLPWEVSYSYGRALQHGALMAWGGKPGNVGAGQRAFAHRARLVSAARDGRYSAKMESEAA
ncbi:class I fructose-bisphosphate aldolase [Oceanibacterium hippocampi]|nr:class I fructose-bisphosphate aldolase [Oceanibacterium hippocampi]